MKRMKSIAWVLVLSCLVGSVGGCQLVEAFFNNVEPGAIFNLSQIGQVDIAGPRNEYIPDYPDYDKDPTCIIPGFCGPSLFYPFSGASASE